MTIAFKACPRCGGDMFLESGYTEQEGFYRELVCIQCGYETDLTKQLEGTVIPIGGNNTNSRR